MVEQIYNFALCVASQQLNRSLQKWFRVLVYVRPSKNINNVSRPRPPLFLQIFQSSFYFLNFH